MATTSKKTLSDFDEADKKTQADFEDMSCKDSDEEASTIDVSSKECESSGPVEYPIPDSSYRFWSRIDGAYDVRFHNTPLGCFVSYGGSIEFVSSLNWDVVENKFMRIL